MDVLLTFNIYLTAASIMLLTFLGAGKPIYRFLVNSSNSAITVPRVINEFVIGFSVTYIFLSLLFTYIPTKWAVQSSIPILIILLCTGVYTEIYSLIKVASRRPTLLFWSLFTGSFILVYLPFFGAHKIFLASEGGGDLTAYLGYANVVLKHSSYPVVETPRLLILMRYVMEWMGLVTVDRPLNYSDIEPAMAAFHNNLVATTYWPTLFFFPLRFIFPISVLYMSLWMLLAAIVPSLIALSIPKNLKWAKLWMGLGFLLVAFSAGFQSIFLNHYIYQLLSIFMIAAFYSSLVQLVANSSTAPLHITICVLALTVICMSYFPATPPSLILAAWGGMIFLLANHWRNPEKSFSSYFPTRLLGWGFLVLFMLLPFFFETFYRVPTIELVKKPTPEMIQTITAVWGPSVHVFNELWNGLQGTLIHNLAQPYTTLNFQHLWNYQLAPLSVALLILCLFPLVQMLRKSFKSPKLFWQSQNPLMLLAVGSLITVIGFLFLCNTHTYIFDKMAMLMLPVTIMSIIILLSMGFENSGGALKITIGTLTTVFLLAWLAGNIQMRFFQVASFYNNADRTAILYTQDYLRAMPIPKNPSRTFMYANTTGAGTSYFLMEASLSGMNGFPANNFYHENYPSFLAKIDFTRSNYVIANGNSADAYDITHFYLGNDEDFAVPIDPFLDPAASTLPKKIVVERATPEGTGIILQATHTWHVRCRPFEKINVCQMEKAMLGEKKYDSIIEQPNIDGSCLFEVKNQPGSQVLHFTQCHEILFEQV